MFKGLLAGVITGAIARRMRNLPLGIVRRLLASAVVTFPIAWMQRDNDVTHKNYFWAIMIPGGDLRGDSSLATQRYGKSPAPAAP